MFSFFDRIKTKTRDMEVEICDPIPRESWDSDILPIPGSGFFHTRAWATVLSESYGFHPLYIRLHRGSRLIGVLPLMDIRRLPTPRRGISLPFTDHCNPLFSNADFPALFSAAARLGQDKNWKYLEFRTTCSDFDGHRPYETFYGHVLNLTEGESRLFSGLSGATRRNIRKAEREGVEVAVGNTWLSMAAYYRLHCLTRKRQGVPPQPLKFFKKIQEHVISKQHGVVILASRQGKTIAGGVFFHFHDEALYKFGASDPVHQELRASNRVMWEAIRHYAGNGFRNLCFGRTEIGNEGLRRFKLGWGPTERTIRYHRYSIPEKAFLAGGTARSPRWSGFFRKLPVPVLRLIGTAAYGYMG